MATMIAMSPLSSSTAPSGPLCQRHARNAYARTGTAKKRKSKREAEDQRLREEFGQADMFADTEWSE